MLSLQSRFSAKRKQLQQTVAKPMQIVTPKGVHKADKLREMVAEMKAGKLRKATTK